MSSGNWKELFDAACAGDLDLVRYHLGAGVDVNYIHPEYSGTVLVAALLSRQEAVAHCLLDHGAQPDQFSALDGMRPLRAARQAGLASVEQRLTDLGLVDATANGPEVAPNRWSWRRWVGLSSSQEYR